jgi:hypothetical protein
MNPYETVLHDLVMLRGVTWSLDLETFFGMLRIPIAYAPYDDFEPTEGAYAYCLRKIRDVLGPCPLTDKFARILQVGVNSQNGTIYM